MNHVTSSVVDLTPELAANLIGRNNRNRNISVRNYSKIVRAIERDEWVFNGEAIKVADTGLLLDGQHRCLAVIETGKSIRVVLIQGLPESTRDTMDTGRPRTLGNVLQMRGHKDSNRLAAAIRRMVVAERVGFKAAFVAGTVETTRPEELAWFERNPWVEDYMIQSRNIASDPGILLSSTSVVALLSRFDAIDQEDSMHFWDKLRSGEDLSRDHPIMALRRAFKRLGELKGQHDQYHLAGLTIKAWNKYRRGESASLLRFKSGGANPETFPMPV